MNLRNQVCTAEQAQKLKDLGISQSAAFSWFLIKDRDDEVGFNRKSGGSCPVCGHPTAPYIQELSAFTVAELGHTLPDDVRSYRFEDSWQIYYPDEGGMNLFVSEDCDTEAQIRAAFLIWGLESGHLTVAAVNERKSS